MSHMTKKLEQLNNHIEKLDKSQHIEILKILSKRDMNKITENKNGIFVNMNELSSQSIDDISNYLEYIKTKEKDLDVLESEKNNYKNMIENEITGE